MRSRNILGGLLVAALVLAGCEHDVDGGLTDRLLLEAALDTATVNYVNTPAITDPAGNSPHGTFRVRFNAVAAAALDSTGKLPGGSSFPPNSVVVKDIYLNGALDLFAVMKKAPGDQLAAGGWLWNEVRPDGSVVFSAGRKGDGCIGCHSNDPNRDLVRVFDLY
ncbi:MAG: cytochrome P460 family protein [Flavobacteriales bacterium]|nr:MAG: cytochrome P460 family protein [Flavobacteriales bacterium]